MLKIVVNSENAQKRRIHIHVMIFFFYPFTLVLILSIRLFDGREYGQRQHNFPISFFII